MTEAEVIDVMRHFLEGKFPKRCGVCQRTYTNLKDYLLHTTHVGRPRSYDIEMGILRPKRPIGTMSLANCSCGNTLVIDSSGMSLWTLWRLMGWLTGEMSRRREPAPIVLEDLRRAIDQATLAAPAAAKPIDLGSGLQADALPRQPGESGGLAASGASI